jgi:hypothetical protein
MIYNDEKLNICISILNDCISKYYTKYCSYDKYFLLEFTPCCNEEKKVLELCLQKILEKFGITIISENVLYWTVVYYYYNTIVLEYNVVQFFHQHRMRRYIEMKTTELKCKENNTELNKFLSVKFDYKDVELMTTLMLQISFSDEKWATTIRQNILNYGEDIKFTKYI